MDDQTSHAVTILGCGYVGKAVACQWRSAGLTVTATTTTPDRLAELADLCDRPLCLRANDPTALKAALVGQSVLLVSLAPRRSGIYRETYLESAQTLAAVLPTLPDLRQVIYTGSYSVYGDYGGKWIDETAPTNPSAENSQILLETEQYLQSVARPDLAVCIFRLGGICGPGREIADIFRSASGGTRPGTGQDWSNWIHLDDIVGAIDFARDRSLDGLYNLVHDRPMMQKELLDQAFQVRGWAGVTWNPNESANRSFNARVSNQKLRDAGYQFRYDSPPFN
ncbi:MAG: NAD-dependent epimerase/dehydratase family protein [Oscillatoriales cyanobacterium]|nr:MAG: NAD-dependent epimerase/dehydratase family protein [Oscillatoriales cyanobacterium]